MRAPNLGLYASMLIVADENMPLVRELFSSLGEIRTLPGRSIDADAVRNANILLVRSITRVDRELLDDSRVRFVGSATIGTDHLDIDYLNARGIAYANAPGCNATAVVEYVLSCFAAIEGLFERLMTRSSVGIIGLGNVGSKLCVRLQALGIQCIGYDPYLSNDSTMPLAALNTVLQSDVICCHTPLTRNGKYPTWHMLDGETLMRMRSDTILINAGRGAVIDNAALPQWLSQHPQARVLLDVWEHEPLIDADLLKQVSIATPHIAGYSLDGKWAGTRMVFTACCEFLGRSAPALAQPLSEALPSISLDAELPNTGLMRAAIQAVYDVRGDDERMRAAMRNCEFTETARAFDELRKNYPERREFGAVRIENWKEFSAEKQRLLSALGFVRAML